MLCGLPQQIDLATCTIAVTLSLMENKQAPPIRLDERPANSDEKLEPREVVEAFAVTLN
jgi:hypothetical protein